VLKGGLVVKINGYKLAPKTVFPKNFYFRGNDLSGANLTGAILKGAIINGTDLTVAIKDID
jgi:uncharacterized protein YjbI with pentapeptide repeats